MASSSNRNPSQNPTERGKAITTAISTKTFSEKAVKFEEQFNRLIPHAIRRSQLLTGQRVVGLLVNLWMQSESVRECLPSTILNAAALACAVGLEFNNALGQSYIIPYEISRKIGGQWIKRKEATWQAGYRGLLTLAQRSDKVEVPYAQLVMPDDFFDYEHGTSEFLRNKPAQRDPHANIADEFTHAYFYVKMRSGYYSFHVMAREDVLAIRDKSAQSVFDDEGNPKPSSPWNKFAGEMIRKTPTKQHLKYLDLTSHLSMATGLDDQAEAGAAQDVVIDWKDYSTEDVDNDKKPQTQGYGPGESKQTAKQPDGQTARQPNGQQPEQSEPQPAGPLPGMFEEEPPHDDTRSMTADDTKGPFSNDMFYPEEYESLFEDAKRNGHCQNKAQFGALGGRWNATKGEFVKFVRSPK